MFCEWLVPFAIRYDHSSKVLHKQTFYKESVQLFSMKIFRTFEHSYFDCGLDLKAALSQSLEFFVIKYYLSKTPNKI